MHSKLDPKVISETDPTVLVRSLRKTATQGGYSAREVHLLAGNIQKVDRTFRPASNRSDQISAICGWRWRVEHSYTDYAQIKDDKTPHSHGMCGTPRQDYLHQVFRSRAEQHYRDGEYDSIWVSIIFYALSYVIAITRFTIAVAIRLTPPLLVLSS